MRPRYAFLSEGFIYGFSRQLFKGVDEAARALDVDLVGITCGPLAGTQPEMQIRNILYEHIDPSLYDGFIVPYSSLGQYAGYETFNQKLAGVFRKPCVTIGGSIPGHPAIVPDWEPGMHLLAEHLVRVHGCRRFLFIRGKSAHQMSNTRETGLRKSLSIQGLPASCLEVHIAEFTPEAGAGLARELSEADRLKDFDALIFVSDSVATGALRQLQSQGIRVPGDLIVCAASHTSGSSHYSPRLTTLDEEVVTTGHDALTLLASHQTGKSAAEPVMKPVKLRIGDSCGCHPDNSPEPGDEVPAMLEYFQLFRQLGFSFLSDSRFSEVFPLLHKALGMEYCSIALFERGPYPYPESRLVANWNRGTGQYHGFNGPLFETRHFVTDAIFNPGRMSVLIEPLYYKDNSLGVFAMDFGPHNGLVYEVILSQFSSTIYLSLQHSLLENAEKRFYDMAFASSDWLWEIDQTGRITYSSGASVELMGIKTENLIGTDFFDVLLPQDQEQVDSLHHRMLETREVIRNQEVMSRKANGSPIFFLLSGKPVRDETDSFAGYRGACRDITNTKQAEERIRQMAYSDALTGLPNRRLFLDRLETEFKNVRRSHHSFALIFVDLDNFKLVNDSLGHEKGDELLRLVAACFARCIRTSDTLARVGGDEFIFLLPKVHSAPAAIVVAERILETFAQRFAGDPEFGSVGASLGIAMYPEAGDDLDTLLRNADIAMYQAKAAGRGRYQFYASSQAATENLPRKSVRRRKTRELFLPVQELGSRKIVGFRTGIADGRPASPGTINFRHISEHDEMLALKEETIHLVHMAETIQQWNRRYQVSLACVHHLGIRYLTDTTMFAELVAALDRLPLDRGQIWLAVPAGLPHTGQGHLTQSISFLEQRGHPLILSGCSVTEMPLSLISAIHFGLYGFSATELAKLHEPARHRELFGIIAGGVTRLGGSLMAEGVDIIRDSDELARQGFTHALPAWPEAALEALAAERLLMPRH